MATASGKARCAICDKERSAVKCEGCQQIFCYDHISHHRQQLSEQLNEIEINRDLFRQTLNEQIQHPQQHALIKEIDQWESESIRKIQRTAKECKQMVLEHTNEHFHQIEVKLSKLTDHLKQTRQENDYNETDLNQLKVKLIQLTTALDQLENVSIQKDSSPFIRKISVIISSNGNLPTSININTKWKQAGLTIAGGNGNGSDLNQLSGPCGIFIDDDHQCIYIADTENHRIMEWKYGARAGQVVAGGNGKGSQINQLNQPMDVLIDKKNDSLIICDHGNRRIVEWPRRNGTEGQTIISDIGWSRLAMDQNGDLYVSDAEKNEVRRWKIEGTSGIIVAGGNGSGSQLNQLNCPSNIFVDNEYSVYVSDNNNHRVMKWTKGSKDGIVVAGGNGKGDSLTQLSYPNGIFVDQSGNLYTTEYRNDRVMRWPKGSKKGCIIVGGTGKGQQSNQFDGPIGISCDQYGNLCISDDGNHRVQKFEIVLN